MAYNPSDALRVPVLKEGAQRPRFGICAQDDGAYVDSDTAMSGIIGLY